MPAALTDTLCTRCGLCCDGTLLADVELAGREPARLELLGLEVDDADGQPVLVLPCAALRGTRCSVYAHRPACCRTFECALLRDAQQGAVTPARAVARISEAHKRIARVKRLLAQLGPGDETLPLMERCAEALSRESDGDAALVRRQAELETAMRGVETLVRTVFLRGAGK